MAYTNCTFLNQDSVNDLYQRRLKMHLDSERLTNDIEQDHQHITNAIHKTAKEAIGEVSKQEKTHWWNHDIEDLIEKKKLAYNKWMMTRTTEDRKSYKRANKIVKDKIKYEKNRMWELKCREIDRMVGGSQSSEVWRLLRSMRNNTQHSNLNIFSMEEWTRHYETLLIENKPDFTEINDDVMAHISEHLEVTYTELEEGIKAMKNGRSPGPGGVPVELVKNGGQSFNKQLLQLINNCLQQYRIPKQWKVAYVISIHKNGTRREPGNYRGLSINSTLSRLFNRIIHNILQRDTQHIISEDQNGFTPGRGCADGIYVVQQLIEKRTAIGEETHLAFIDLEKAYDSVPRSRLWQTLKQQNVDSRIINIIKELYTDNRAYIKQGDKFSRPLMPSKGLRQGCGLSPLLFNLYLERALKEWRRSCGGMGIPIGDFSLFTQSFADDQVVFAQDAYDMEFMLQRLYQQYQKFGLRNNVHKTKYLVTNTDAIFPIIPVKQVDRFKYLGVTVTKHSHIGTEKKNRIEQSRR